VIVSRVEVVVLGLLAEEPLYGYQVLQRFRERSMGFWVEVAKASVYQSLRRLEDRGYLAGKTQEGDDGPDRRVFRLTRSGRARLQQGLSERAGELAPYETEAGTAMGFLQLLTPTERTAALDARERALRDLLDAVRDERERTRAERGTAVQVTASMLERQEALAKAELGWLKVFRGRAAKLRG
jgi:DNA-binding PadR family transcriptional regulator